MGRMLPVYCDHGKVADWGSFGGDDSEPEFCPDCDAAHRAVIVVEWQASASIGEADAVRHLLERWCSRLMERLQALEVVDPCIELDAGARPVPVNPGDPK